MTRGATGQLRCTLNAVFLYELPSLFDLTGGRLPCHVEYLVPRTKEFLRLAVTVQTPLHLQRGDLPCQRHQIHSSMASGTADPLVDVDAVVKVDKVREIVYSSPLNRFAGPPTLPNGFEIGTVSEDLSVTIHARFSGRNTSKG